MAAADTHAPNPKCHLCNAGAGAAAGMSFSLAFFVPFVWL